MPLHFKRIFFWFANSEKSKGLAQISFSSVNYFSCKF